MTALPAPSPPGLLLLTLAVALVICRALGFLGIRYTSEDAPVAAILL